MTEPSPPTPSSPTRRRFLVGIGATGAAAAAGLVSPTQVLAAPAGTPATTAGTRHRPSIPSGVFALGVASGDPRPDRIVLWTRLAPQPLAGGGMPARRVPVHVEVARDDRFRHVVRRATVTTGPQVAHSIHATIRGLRPDREYSYRFRVGGEISPVGRTRTAPESGRRGRSLRFLSTSCQAWDAGYYTAWEHAVAEDPDLIVFLGDYIYESAPNPAALRLHEGVGEPLDLTSYRNRHGQYRSDPALQAAHATCPWIVTLDDHEVDNNWAGTIPQDPTQQSPEAFLARRAAAFQAWWEHMPVSTPPPTARGLRVYRDLTYGDLARFHVLDTRQYRSDQVTTEVASNEPGRTMTGDAQERWLFRGLARRDVRWQLVAQQTMVAQNDRRAGPDRIFDYDNWDGYRWQRRRLMDTFARTRNPVVLTGDRHATWVCDLKPDFDDPASPVVGAEYTGTSITSGGDGDPVPFHAVYDPVMAESPHWKYINNQRGYLLHDLDRSALVTRERIVSSVRQTTGTTIATRATFVTEDGRPGVSVA